MRSKRRHAQPGSRGRAILRALARAPFGPSLVTPRQPPSQLLGGGGGGIGRIDLGAAAPGGPLGGPKGDFAGDEGGPTLGA